MWYQNRILIGGSWDSFHIKHMYALVFCDAMCRARSLAGVDLTLDEHIFMLQIWIHPVKGQKVGEGLFSNNVNGVTDEVVPQDIPENY